MAIAPPQHRQGETDAPPALGEIRECLDSLRATAGKIRLYGHEHPEAQFSIGETTRRLQELTAAIGPLSLQSSQGGFLWRGYPVSEEREEQAGLGRHVHIEGISQLTFQPGINAEGLTRLLEILRTNLSLPQFEEETLESLLWQAEIPFVTFRAITELMQAEAESGRDDDAQSIRRVVESMVQLREEDLVAGRSFQDGALRRPASGDIVDHWELDAQLDGPEGDDQEWSERFSEEAGDDAQAIEALRVSVRDERASQLISRMIRIFTRVAVMGEGDLKPDKSEELSLGAMRQLNVLGDAVGVLEVVEDLHSFSRRLADHAPRAAGWMRELLRKLYNPVRVGTMLPALDVSNAQERHTLERFLGILPDQALLAFLEAAMRDTGGEERDRAPLLLHALRVMAPRIKPWLDRIFELPPDQALVLSHALHKANLDSLRHSRRDLARHPSAPVREAAFQWYQSGLDDGEDVAIVTAALLDQRHAVRAAATRVLEIHRPPGANVRIEQMIRDGAFATLDAEQKTDLCRAWGVIAGPAGMGLLAELLDSRVGLFGDADGNATVTAAAHGLAAMRSPNAMALLERGARSLSGARRSACRAALAKIHDVPAGNDGT